MVLLGLGVVFGYGGAFASFRHHARGHECGSNGGWEANRGWGHGRWDDRSERLERGTQQVAPIIVQAPAQAVAPAAPVVTPQVFVIMPGATQAMPAAVIPSANVAPASAAP